jgi:hypothetical protein
VPVVVLGALPTRARGLSDVSARDARVLAATTALAPLVHFVSATSDIGDALVAAPLVPTLAPAATDCPLVTIRHRALEGMHVFFVFNEHPAACAASLALGLPASAARILDPETGRARDLPIANGHVSVTLPATRGRVLLVHTAP